MPRDGDGFIFFTRHQANTIRAAAARIFPTDDLGPGAAEAGVVYYIDRALAGPEQRLGDTYARGIHVLDRMARERADGHFCNCPPKLQDAILTELEGTPFFMALLLHTREGMFSDPVHGGNRDMVGWRLLGYPGVHLEFTEVDFLPDALVDKPLQSLADA